MRVEKYIADDMRQAMAKVRENLGRDALILSNRRVNGQTEIIAAVDNNGTLNDPEKLLHKMKEKGTTSAKSGGKGDSGNKEETLSLQDIKKELGRLRNMFEGELSQLSWRDISKRQPNRNAIQNRLERAGLSKIISNSIADKVMPCTDLDEGWRQSLRMTSRLIRLPSRDILETGGVITMLGSTGVGKTTTAAKIAASFAARHGTNQLALISTDQVRIGGREQLLSFGSSLGIPVLFAGCGAELEKAVQSLAQKKLIIIDTAGLSQRDMNLAEKLQALRIDQQRIMSYLVLSATNQEAVSSEIIRKFSKTDLDGAIITHADECDSMGPVISSLIRYKLPLAFVSEGQKIPDDLATPDTKKLIGNLVRSYRLSLQNDSRTGLSAVQRRALSG